MALTKTLTSAGDALVHFWQGIKGQGQVETEPPLGSQEKFGGRTTPNVTVSGLPSQIAGIGTGTVLMLILAYFFLIKKRR